LKGSESLKKPGSCSASSECCPGRGHDGADQVWGLHFLVSDPGCSLIPGLESSSPKLPCRAHSCSPRSGSLSTLAPGDFGGSMCEARFTLFRASQSRPCNPPALRRQDSQAESVFRKAGLFTRPRPKQEIGDRIGYVLKGSADIVGQAPDRPNAEAEEQNNAIACQRYIL